MKINIFSILLICLILFSMVISPIYAIDDAITFSTSGNSLTIKTKNDKLSTAQQWKTILDKYKGVIIGVSGVAALTFLIFFIVNFVKLGQSAGNPQMRSQAVMGIVWCGIACAGLGGIAIFFSFFYNTLR